MKKIITLLVSATLMLLLLQCSDNERMLHSDLDTPPTLKSDTIATPVDTITTMQKLKSGMGKYIYLTIDDAPVHGCNYIDSVIAAEKVKTSIFLVGNVIDGSHRFRKYYDALVQNQYMEIYNHSYSHANNRYADYYQSPQTVLEDFKKNQTAFNISHKIARLPGRNLWMFDDKRKKNCTQTGTTSAELLVADGYEVFGWDVEWHYNSKTSLPTQSVDKLMSEIDDAYHSKTTFAQNHVVLLTHNQMFNKPNGENTLAGLIVKLKEAGYTFAYLSEYPE